MATSNSENGSEDALYFAYGALLRIHGDDLPFDEITGRLQLQPTYWHRKGERYGPWLAGRGESKLNERRDDAWHYEPSIPEDEPLERHITALWAVLEPHAPYLKDLKNRCSILDVYCTYRSNCNAAGIVVPHSCLALFAGLEVSFGLSITIT